MLGEAKVCHKYCIAIFAVLLSFLFIIVDVFAEDRQKNVLILNSYHKGLLWTDEETEGILGILKSVVKKNAVSVEYMDWKNYPTRENLSQIYTRLDYKYARKHLDLVITTDDAALEFALKNRQQLFSNAPVVFCGVNEEGISKITRGYSRVTGVVEEVDREKTIAAAMSINPNLKQVYVVFDNTESGLSTGSLTIHAIQRISPDIRVIPLNEKSLRDILKEVGQAPEDSAVLMTTYYVDVEGLTVGFEGSSEMISKNSKVPVFHLYDFGMGHGAIGGSMLSGKLQGESAGRIAVKVLQGENIAEIPVSKYDTIRYVFDYEQLKRFNIPFSRVPKGSTIINKPFSFFETYRTLVITILIIFFLMGIFICVLLYYLKKISRMKGELYDNHQELAQLYEELTASDEELKQQLDELTEAQGSLVASEERYRLLFEKMLNGFMVFEPVMNGENKLIDVRFVNANPGFEKQTNLKESDVLGKTWLAVHKYPNPNLHIYQHILQTGEAEHFETYNAYTGYYYLINAFKIKDDQIGVVFENITEYRQAIKEVRKLNEELEGRVAERTSELQRVVNELEAFTYTVSHDLKSPLRAVDGYSRIILEDFGEKLENEATEMIVNIRSICKDMIEMINKLLQYSSTSKSAIYREEINIEEMFVSIFNELKSAYPGRDVKLKIETGLPKVSADRILLKQVIYNILSNGIKFTKERDKALITVGCTITEDEYVFYIKDNGVGFDMEFSGKLFGIFQRLHTSDEFEGSGIGLVTVKKIIQKHGGRTWIEGEVNAGATVYFTLPLG